MASKHFALASLIVERERCISAMIRSSGVRHGGMRVATVGQSLPQRTMYMTS